MSNFTFEQFRQRCERQPEPWRQVVGPQPLNASKSRKEQREVIGAKLRTPSDRAGTRARLVQDIEMRLARFKRAYTEYDSVRMQDVAKSLRQPVHALRVLERAENTPTDALPPRRSQFGGRHVHGVDQALAWVHHIDVFLLGNEKKSGVPVDVWRRHFRVAPVDSMTRFHERQQIMLLTREPHYKRIDRVETLVARTRAELDRQPDAYTYPRLDQLVRALRTNLSSLGHDELPPHWCQYRFAGGFPQDNCRVWRTGLMIWFEEYDRVPTYVADDDGAPPAYQPRRASIEAGRKKTRKRDAVRRFLLIA